MKRPTPAQFPPRPASVMEYEGVTITVAPSGGVDGALVVFIDTGFEPDGSDGGPGLRVLINDDDTYVGVPFGPREEA